jgi:hypothetical protein
LDEDDDKKYDDFEAWNKSYKIIFIN